jgi:hypothetical protein
MAKVCARLATVGLVGVLMLIKSFLPGLEFGPYFGSELGEQLIGHLFHDA